MEYPTQGVPLMRLAATVILIPPILARAARCFEAQGSSIGTLNLVLGSDPASCNETAQQESTFV